MSLNIRKDIQTIVNVLRMQLASADDPTIIMSPSQTLRRIPKSSHELRRKYTDMKRATSSSAIVSARKDEMGVAT